MAQLACLLVMPRVRGSIPTGSIIYHKKPAISPKLKTCDDMMMFPVIVVSGIVRIQFLILQCNDGNVELSWKWDMLKPLLGILYLPKGTPKPVDLSKNKNDAL